MTFDVLKFSCALSRAKSDQWLKRVHGYKSWPLSLQPTCKIGLARWLLGILVRIEGQKNEATAHQRKEDVIVC